MDSTAPNDDSDSNDSETEKITRDELDFDNSWEVEEEQQGKWLATKDDGKYISIQPFADVWWLTYGNNETGRRVEKTYKTRRGVLKGARNASMDL